MGRKRKQRRQPHGSAWYWKQTGCWYYTRPGAKKRLPLFDEDGQRIRGAANKEAAELALAKEKISWEEDASGTPGGNGPWPVAGGARLLGVYPVLPARGRQRRDQQGASR